MPFKSEKIKIANTMYDRRIKLTELERKKINELYNIGRSLHSLAREFNVNRFTIKSCIPAYAEIIKQRAEYSKKYSKEHREKGKIWANRMKKHRKYKQDLYLNGKIK